MKASSVSRKTLTFLTCICLITTLPLVSSDADSEKVSLALYYESLCPYSANFIVNHLAKLVEDEDLLSIVDIHLSPWGNAKLKPNDTIVCQHGPPECLFNTVEACAIHVWPHLREHFPFVTCIESLVLVRKYTEWESCFGKLGLNAKPISDCYANGLGKKLELQYGAETDALQPPHKYVPWVVVDGQPLYEDYENFVSYICKAYKGTGTPGACSKVSQITSQIGKANLIVPVSYKESNRPTFTEQIISVFKWMQQMIGIASV